MKYVLSEKRLQLPEKAFQASIENKKGETKARYEREYRAYHGKPKQTQQARSQPVPRASKTGTTSTKPKKYVLSEKRLQLPYDDFQATIRGADAKTKKRYERARVQYHKDHLTGKAKANPEYRIILELDATNGRKRFVYYQAVIVTKPRINQKEMKELAKMIAQETNVRILGVRVAKTWDNWTGDKV